MEDSTTANDDFVKLLEMVNEKEEMIDGEFTEEELKTAFSPNQSPEPDAMDVSYGDDEHFALPSNTPIQTHRQKNGSNCKGDDDGDDIAEVMVTTRAKATADTNCNIATRSADGDDDGGNSDRDEPNDFDYFSFQMMDHHITKGKHGKKLYKCDVCSAVYRHSFSLKRHFIRTHVNYAYLCETDVTNCGINLPASSSLRAWQSKSSVSSSSSPSPPIELNGACNGEKSGEEESTCVDNEKSFKKGLYCCHSCILFFSRLSGLQNHFLVQHRNNESGSIEPAKIPCQHCNMSFVQRHNLMRHIDLVHHHRGNGKSSSGKSSKVNNIKPVPERRTLERHRKVSRFINDDDQDDDPDDGNDEDLFECHHCLAKFTLATDLLKHVESSHSFDKASKGRDRNHCSVFNSSYRDDARMEANFYRTLAQRISENLLYHVDGKPKANPVNHDVVTSQGPGKSNETKLNLIDYNFPSGFNNSDDNELAKINFLLDVELKNCHSLEQFTLSTVTSPSNESQDKAKHEKIYICNACGQSFASLSVFDLHEINNHPNIFCNFIEMDIDSNIPTSLLRWKNISPTGLLKICKVPQIDASSENSPSIKCTKCSRKFSHVSCLHEHILECASMSTNFNQDSTESTSNQDDQNHHQVSKDSSLSSSSSVTSPASPKANHNSTNESTCKQNSSTPSVSYNTRSAKRRSIDNSSTKFPNKKEKFVKKSRVKEENVQDVEENDEKVDSQKDDNNNDCFVDSETSNNLENSLSDGDTSEKMQRRKRDCSYRERRCPLCLRVFKYMANLKKHLQAGCRASRAGTGSPSDPVAKNTLDSSKADADSSSVMSNANFEKKTLVSSDDVSKDEQKLDKDDTTDKLEEEAKSTNKDKTKVDLMRVKQDYPQYAFKGSPAQHHSCPYCQRGFTYLANFRRHMQDECPMRFPDAIKKQSVLNESNMSNNIKSKVNSSSSKQSQDDDSSLKPSKDQAKQDEDVKVSEDKSIKSNNPSTLGEVSVPGNSESNPSDGTENKASNNSTKFQTYSCNICHKIYFCHLQFLKHHISHKLDMASCDSNRSNSKNSIDSGKKLAPENQSQLNESNCAPANLNDLCSPSDASTIRFTESLSKPLSFILDSLARGGTEDRVS